MMQQHQHHASNNGQQHQHQQQQQQHRPSKQLATGGGTNDRRMSSALSGASTSTATKVTAAAPYATTVSKPPVPSRTNSMMATKEENDSDDAGMQSGDDDRADDGDVDQDGDDDALAGSAGGGGARPGKRKRPVSVSCELCKQRKVKCDRGQPSCGWCSRNNATCEYKERKKPGLRAGYGRELEARLDKLEEILRAHDEILSQANLLKGLQRQNTVTSSSTAGGSMAGVATASSAQPGVLNRTNSDHGTTHDAPQQGGNSMYRQSAETALFLQKATGPSSSYAQGSQQDYVGMTTTPQTPTVADRAYQAQQQLQTSQGGADHEFANSALQSPPLPPPTSSARASVGSDGDMPPYDLLYSLVDLYFKHINQWCPILHRKATLEALFGASAGVGEPRSAEDTETDRILLHAIVATTLRYSNDPRLTEERKQHYYSVAKSKVLLYGMENSSVKALQALVILALDLLGSGHGPPGWNIMALLVRSVVQLGLSVETTSFSVSPNYQSIYTLREMILPEPKDFIEEESRRRLFWMVYLLDRYATIATAFEFALDDREIDRLLPCRDDLWMKNQKVETRWFKAGSDYYLPPFSPPAGDTPGTAPGTFGDAAPGTGGRPSPEHADVSGQGGAAGAAGACRQSVSGASAVSISVSGPGPGSGPGSAENLGAFSYYIEILGILSKIHQFLKQPVNISAPQDVDQWQRRYKELDATLTNWKYSLPADYGNMGRLFQPGSAKQLSAGWIMLHATYHTAIIRLHSSAAYPTTRSHIFTPSYSASQRCHSAVENIATLGEWVVNNNMMPRLGPPFAFTLWVSARLLLVHGSTVEGKLSPQIPLLVDWLKAMGQWWPVARRYAGLLTRVLDEHAEAQGRGDGVVPGSVKILADMRRTAFDLELLMTRTPRHGHGHYVHGSSGSGDGHNQHGHQHQSHGVQSHQPGSSGGSQHTSAPAQAGHQQHHYMPGFGQSTATTNGHAWNGQVTATTTAATDSTAQGQWQGASDGNAGDSANNGGSSAAAGASINRLASTTPALNPAIQAVRTPAPNELEYLDVFDFFNYPRLPQGMVNLAAGGGVMHGGLSGHQHAVEMDTSGDGAAGGSNGGGLMVTGTGPGGISVVMPDGFNITNFMPDASSDWLFKHDGGKFMA